MSISFIKYYIRKKLPKKEVFLVDRDGFEPSKSETTDLQSVPFSHSGTCPKYEYDFIK